MSIKSKIGLLFIDTIDNDKKDFINNCNLASKGKKDKLVTSNGINFWLTKSDFEIYKKVIDRIQNKNLKLLLNRDTDIRLKKEKITSKERNRLYKIGEKLGSEKSILSKILLINLYLDLKLNGKVESVINSVIKNEYISDFFYSEGTYIDQEKTSKRIIDILLKLEDHFDDKRLVETFISYIAYGISTELRKELVSEFDIPNKLSYVQERVKSVNYAIMYPFVWTPWIEKYSSSVELQIYLNKTQIYEYLKDGELKYLSSFRSSFPMEKHKRELILKSYKRLLKSNIPYLSDIKFRIHQNEGFQKYLIKNKISTKPVFVEMKKFYRSQIKKNESISYGLYNLLKIGDIKDEYFIKALALRNNGL